LCELIGRQDLIERQYEADQEALAAELASTLETRSLADWLAVFEGEDVMAGPVSTLAEAAARLGTEPAASLPPALGEHTEQWRRDLASNGG
jgi:crotonobetainyl-CoA:carnitine CoA-transferase CaiB-like acyl-CoA transferase